MVTKASWMTTPSRRRISGSSLPSAACGSLWLKAGRSAGSQSVAKVISSPAKRDSSMYTGHSGSVGVSQKWRSIGTAPLSTCKNR